MLAGYRRRMSGWVDRGQGGISGQASSTPVPFGNYRSSRRCGRCSGRAAVVRLQRRRRDCRHDREWRRRRVERPTGGDGHHHADGRARPRSDHHRPTERNRRRCIARRRRCDKSNLRVRVDAHRTIRWQRVSDVRHCPSPAQVLAAVRASGVPLVVEDGWDAEWDLPSRQSDWHPIGVMLHHTGSSAPGDAPTLQFLLDYESTMVLTDYDGLAGGKRGANFLIGRDGTVYLLRATRGPHAGIGGPMNLGGDEIASDNANGGSTASRSKARAVRGRVPDRRLHRRVRGGAGGVHRQGFRGAPRAGGSGFGPPHRPQGVGRGQAGQAGLGGRLGGDVPRAGSNPAGSLSPRRHYPNRANAKQCAPSGPNPATNGAHCLAF